MRREKWDEMSTAVVGRWAEGGSPGIVAVFYTVMTPLLPGPP